MSRCAIVTPDAVSASRVPVPGTPLSWFARGLLRSAATDAVRPWAVRRLRNSLAQTPRLHIGCGPVLLSGWVNVDLLGRTHADVPLNVRRPLPLADESVDAVYHEHLIEHLPYEQALALIRECARILRPGGVLRVGVPDFGRYAASYVGDGLFLESARPGRASRLLALAEVAYCHGHRSLWDSETLVAALTAAGLPADERPFGASVIAPCPDHRPEESLYVEGVK